MASLGTRLQRLEAQVKEASSEHGSSPSLRAARLLCVATQNARREQEGLPPLPLADEEEEWRCELDSWFLTEGLPEMQRSPGWQDEESQAFLSQGQEELEKASFAGTKGAR